MNNKIEMTVTEGEYNILLNALNLAKQDIGLSALAKRQYTNLYVKLTEDKPRL